MPFQPTHALKGAATYSTVQHVDSQIQLVFQMKGKCVPFLIQATGWQLAPRKLANL